MDRSRRRSNGNAIRGPQSALTDFLASHNISAQQINLDYQQRVRDAEQQAAQAAAAAAAEENKPDSSDEEDAAERKKRKRKEEKAIAKIKASKEFKKRKFEHHRDNPDESSNDDALVQDMMNKPKAPPKPGQFANCDVCEKRFTVTPYTVAGPDGGFLCTKCGKEIKDEKKKADHAAKKKKATPKARKRQTESDRMMGDVKPGAKSLVEHCVRKVADVVNDVEDFGELPQKLLDRLSQILSKKRVLTPRTLQLFLQPGIDRINVYDCAKLESEDFQKIFAFMPDLETVNLRFAGQLKDDSLHYMLEKNHKIKHLQLGATNLISDPAWIDLFQQMGSQLETLKLSELNDAMKDSTVEIMAAKCTTLRRLKMRSCPHMTEASINSISTMTTIEHLSLSVAQDSGSEVLVNLISNLGPNLKTLSLEDYFYADDTVLAAIKQHCTRLKKLRLTGGASFTDAMFANLFWEDWSNPPIPFVDLSCNRDTDPDIGPGEEEAGNPDAVGFGSNAFKGLFQHSGSNLERLDLHSNRHISHEALIEVFDGVKIYPALQDIDLSFVTHVDDVVMSGIFKSCPALQKLTVFACFSINELQIPRGIAVIGIPTAQTAVEVVGES
ncbi:UV-damaged DNA-binding protein rad7 [Lithohypha guttulata]|uniref:UV-damaged DNA-binding protein rad7 n=1 Tax=Lithohypha guttulata TaxID=1690604 RepID=A0AAN7YEJ7_9EURO|nr:UV-damaged DNA-binding protein rad7 [Lithohypha guttulata]KAK5082778.1 UV-damaged DNA-binding protein rad7 [Lithohypha guttulata]